MDFYYYSLCHTCKKPSPSLKKCSGCRVLHYCSRQHQVRDWRNHKELCKIIAKTNETLLPPTRLDAEQFTLFKSCVGRMWRTQLGRDMLNSERQMWMFPKVCEICYSQGVTIICQTCLSVAYCSEEHRSSHQKIHGKYCQTFKLCLMFYQKAKPQDVPRNFLKVGKINREIQCLPGNIEEVMALLGFSFQPVFSKQQVLSIMMSQVVGPVCSMVFALEKSGFLINRHGRKSNLLVYHVGLLVRNFKITAKYVIEFLSHWITNLQFAKFVLMGPGVQEGETTTMTCDCGQCRAKSFNGVVLEICRHDPSSFDKERPDLVVAYSSGLHPFFHTEDDTYWKKIVAKMIRFGGIPALLTAYTESELEKDLALFADSVEFLVKPQRNPYLNLKPIRNWGNQKYDPVLYQNSYITVLYSEKAI